MDRIHGIAVLKRNSGHKNYFCDISYQAVLDGLWSRWSIAPTVKIQCIRYGDTLNQFHYCREGNECLG